MNLILSFSGEKPMGTLNVPGSKSESNRLLVLRAFFPQITIENLSGSDDTKLVQNALISTENAINIGHAGTAMRFLTAYFSVQEGRKVVLTGSERMQNRPIGMLVDALRKLGADISYDKKEGFPPVHICGKKLKSRKVKLPANISSQYISALMLIAPSLPNGLEMELQNSPVSFSYLEMTQKLLEKAGISCQISENIIRVFPVSKLPQKIIGVEPDWSSASYFFSMVALSSSAEIKLLNFKEPKFSAQGDSVVAQIYKKFGVETTISEKGIILKKAENKLPGFLKLDLSNTPDLAQTIAVSCLGLKIPCELIGLQTLKIKETDRLLALKTELGKCGAKVVISENSLKMFPPEKLPDFVEIDTYNDHRMAMAFAPLAMKMPLQINHAEVVSKSYPDFWLHFSKMARIEKLQ